MTYTVFGDVLSNVGYRWVSLSKWGLNLLCQYLFVLQLPLILGFASKQVYQTSVCRPMLLQKCILILLHRLLLIDQETKKRPQNVVAAVVGDVDVINGEWCRSPKLTPRPLHKPMSAGPTLVAVVGDVDVI